MLVLRALGSFTRRVRNSCGVEAQHGRGYDKCAEDGCLSSDSKRNRVGVAGSQRDWRWNRSIDLIFFVVPCGILYDSTLGRLITATGSTLIIHRIHASFTQCNSDGLPLQVVPKHCLILSSIDLVLSLLRVFEQIEVATCRFLAFVPSCFVYARTDRGGGSAAELCKRTSRHRTRLGQSRKAAFALDRACRTVHENWRCTPNRVPVKFWECRSIAAFLFNDVNDRVSYVDPTPTDANRRLISQLLPPELSPPSHLFVRVAPVTFRRGLERLWFGTCVQLSLARLEARRSHGELERDMKRDVEQTGDEYAM